MSNTYNGDPVSGLITLEFIGHGLEMTIAHGREYKGDTQGSLSQVDAHPDDVQILLDSGLWKKAVEVRPATIPDQLHELARKHGAK